MAFTQSSKLLANPRGDENHAFEELDRHPNGEYDSGAVRRIVDLYWDLDGTWAADRQYAEKLVRLGNTMLA